MVLHRGVGYVADSDKGIQVFNPLAPDLAGNAPAISFVANFPTNPARAQFGAPIQLLVDARDDIHTREVTAFVDGNPVAEDASYPFQLEFNAPAASSGLTQFSLRLRAIDTAGNTRWTDPLVVQLADIPSAPRLVSLEPAPGSKADNLGLISIVVELDGRIAPDSIRADTLTILGAGSDRVFGTADDVAQAGITQLGGSPNILEFTKTTNFPAGLYRIVLNAGLRGTNAVERTEPVSWLFEAFAARPSLARTVPSGTTPTPDGGLTNLQAILSLAISSGRTIQPTFSLRAAGPDRTRGTADDIAIPLASARLKPNRDGYDITPVNPIPAGRYRLSMSGTGYTASLVDFELRPVPNLWIAARGGRWNSDGNWSGGTPIANDFIRIPKLPPGAATTNGTLVALARVESEGDFVQEAGQLEITGTAVFEGLSRFLGTDSTSIDFFGGGRVINRGTMHLRGGATFANRVLTLQDITIDNQGLLEWQAGQLFFRHANALIFNEPSGIFDIGDKASRSETRLNPLGQILNAGLMRKIAGTNVTDLGTVTLENSGKLLIGAGQLLTGDLQGPGEIEIQGGATLASRRFMRLPNEARVFGDGDMLIAGGTSNAPMVLTHRHELTGLTVAESNFIEVRRALEFPGLQFQSRNGWFRFMAPVRVQRLWTFLGSFDGIQLNAPAITEVLQLERGILRGPGTVEVTRELRWANGRIDQGGEITVLANAELRGNGTLTERQLRLAPGATLLAVSNSSITTVTRGLEGRLINEGTFLKNTPGRVNLGISFENRGILRLEQGQVTFARTPESDGRIFQAGGEIQFAGGDLELYLQSDNIGTSLTSNNGGISGYGRIVSASLSASAPIDNSSLFRLNVPGKALQLVAIGYRQSSKGTLEITLGDAGPAQLIGDPGSILRLAGRLRVVLQEGHTPQLGQSLVLCQGQIGDKFTQLDLPDLGPSLKLEVAYSTTNVVLNVVAKP